MAVIEMQKIKLVASTAHRQKLLDLLQSKGVMEVTEIIGEEEINKDLAEAHCAELNIANIEFALKLIKPFAKQRSLLLGPVTLSIEDVRKKAKEFNFEDVINKCRRVEEISVALKNEHAGLTALLSELEPWVGLLMPLNHICETEKTKTIIGSLQKTAYSKFNEDINKVSKLIHIQKAGEDESAVYIALVYAKELEKEVREVLMLSKFSEADLPRTPRDVKDEIAEIKKRISEIENELKNQEEALKSLAANNEDLQIAHDYFVWERDKIYAEQKALNTQYAFAIEGWAPVLNIDKLKTGLAKVTEAFEIIEIEPGESEQAPVAIRNKGLIDSFESVTNIYGLPLPHEVDPTPFLAAFFIVFFGLCLTDAGYGIVLFVVCGLALKFLKFGEGIKKLVKLLMIGGIVTFVLGALFGGWFGMTADQAPGFMTYTTTEGIKAFKWQIINPTQGNGPLTFLILAAILGYIQVLFGIAVNGWWKIKHKKYLDAFFDSFLWFYFLIIMGLFGLSKTGVFLADYSGIITNLVWVGVIALVLTQGRGQKNIILKFFSGVLSLYGLVGYFADVLSYSRLMALGLGTGIIGFAFNTIGGLVGNIPYIGIIFTIIVILIGHVLNIAISTLGAFIHSSRLQFVEFFGKFMEGGGRSFKPLKKSCKYINIL
ncbi:V-type ATP synthase subunit I [Candidatus Peregrinibacteria bacterium]|nr:V-type ATP synthase subunit I [Candidatus Peregrinibacteria bacterium]